MSNELKISLGVTYANGAAADAVAMSTYYVNQNALGLQGEIS